MMRAIILVAPDADPSRQVGGLGLLERCLLTVESWGADGGSVLAPGDAIPDAWHASELLFVSASAVYDRRTGAALGGPLVGGARRVAGALRVAAGALAACDLAGVTTPDGVVDALRRQGVAVEEPPAAHLLYEPVRDAADARRAERKLFESCRKPVDGLVSRHLNRRVSLFLSRHLVATRVHPNHVSVLCIALGAVAALLVLGGHGWVIAGAVVFQLNSILDGVDGELARVRWQASKLGELLDSAGDNFANFAYFSALAWVAAREGHGLLAGLGAAGLALWSLYLVFLYTRLSTLRRGDVLLVTEGGAVLVQLGRTLLRRDSFVMLALVLALAGHPFWMLPFVLLGGASVSGYAVAAWARALGARFRAGPASPSGGVKRAPCSQASAVRSSGTRR